MAMLRAPYNNAMRLGQGVNSFTQTLCILDAVQKKQSAETTSKDDSRPGLGISQIVSYSSRFVDKVSDVMKDMNVSAALAIKTGGFEGSGSGKYINTDKFKEADLNFFIQVKVTNQEHMEADYTEFKDYGVDRARFTDVYGDTFISGWEEGGEFNALLSIKLKDKSSATHISGQLEASLGHGVLKGAAQGSLDESLTSSDAETTVTVNWSGGGQLKDVDAPWDIKSMSQAATNFADLVAMTPQRKYAILTKYTMLSSFWMAATKFSPLDYENAGIYSSQLLETYSDYKAIWKDLQVITEDFQSGFGNFELVESSPSSDIADRLKSVHDDAEMGAIENDRMLENLKVFALLDAAGTELSKQGDTGETKPDLIKVKGLLDAFHDLQNQKDFEPSIPKYKPYPATIIGLLDARHDCRLEMVKIVNEVDNVTLDPRIALDPQRKTTFIHAALFKELIPVKREVKFYEGDPVFLVPEGKATVQRYAASAADWRMSAAWTTAGEPGREKDTMFFNDLTGPVEPGHAFAVTVYTDERYIRNIATFYTNGLVFRHHNNGKEWKFIETFEWDKDQQKPVQEVVIRGHMYDQRSRVDSIGLFPATNTKDPSAPQLQGTIRPISHAPSLQWNLAGFWGLRGVGEIDGGFTELGVIWGRINTAANDRLVTPSLFDGDAASSVPPRLRDTLGQHSELSRYFRLSQCAGDPLHNGRTLFGSNILDYRWRGLHPHRMYYKLENNWFQTITIDMWSGQGLMNVPDPSNAAKENGYTLGNNAANINEVEIRCSKKVTGGDPTRVAYIEFRMQFPDGGRLTSTFGARPADADALTTVIRRPPPYEGREWWFCGFYGSTSDGLTAHDGITNLGVVWAGQWF